VKGVGTSCQRSRIPPEVSLSGTYPPHSAASFLQKRTGTPDTFCITTNHRAVGCGVVVLDSSGSGRDGRTQWPDLMNTVG